MMGSAVTCTYQYKYCDSAFKQNCFTLYNIHVQRQINQCRFVSFHQLNSMSSDISICQNYVSDKFNVKLVLGVMRGTKLTFLCYVDKAHVTLVLSIYYDRILPGSFCSILQYSKLFCNKY
jgi:hypothetical protein